MEYGTTLGFQENSSNFGGGMETPEMARLNVSNKQIAKRASLMNDLGIRGGGVSIYSSQMLEGSPDGVKLKRKTTIRQIEGIPEEVMQEEKVRIDKKGIDDLGITVENQRRKDHGITLVDESLIQVQGKEAAQ